jgi:hypothetical protein
MILIGILWDSKLGKFPDLASDVTCDFWESLTFVLVVQGSGRKSFETVGVKYCFSGFI